MTTGVAYEALRDFSFNGQAFEKGEMIVDTDFGARRSRLLESARYIRPVLRDHPPSKKRTQSTSGGIKPPAEEKSDGTPIVS